MAPLPLPFAPLLDPFAFDLAPLPLPFCFLKRLPAPFLPFASVVFSLKRLRVLSFIGALHFGK
jgi:hypothetical protein